MSGGACDLSEIVWPGRKDFGEVFGRLTEMSVELMPREVLAELSLGLDAKSLLSWYYLNHREL